MFFQINLSDNLRNGFLSFAFADACLFVFTHYFVLYMERHGIRHPYSDEADAKFKRLAFYGVIVGLVIVLHWSCSFGWLFAFQVAFLLIDGVYILQYMTATTQESEKIEANDTTEDKPSESANKNQEEMYVENKEIDLATRLSEAIFRIKELQDQCHEHYKEKEDLTTTLNQATKSLYNISKDVARLRDENIDLVTKLSEADSSYQFQLHSISKDLTRLREENIDLVIRLSEADLWYDWYQFQVQITLDYENRNTILEQENEELQDKLNEMKSSYELFDEVKSSYEFYRTCYRDTEEDYMNLVEEKIELSATMAAKTEFFNETLQELADNCRILEEENSDAHRKISIARMSSNELEEKCMRLEQEKAELKCEISATKVDVAVVNELEEECRRLEEEKTKLLCENSAAKVGAEALKELEEKCKRLEQEKTELLSEVTAAKVAAELYQSYLHDLDEDDLVMVG